MLTRFWDLGSAYAPTTRTVRKQLAAPAVSTSSVDEVQLASCCWCRCRPAGVAAETTAASTASLSTGKGTSCGPFVCLCYTRVAVHGRSFPSARVMVVVLPFAFCPKRISVGRAHHHRKRRKSIRRFRTKLTSRRNILH